MRPSLPPSSGDTIFVSQVLLEFRFNPRIPSSSLFRTNPLSMYRFCTMHLNNLIGDISWNRCNCLPLVHRLYHEKGICVIALMPNVESRSS